MFSFPIPVFLFNLCFFFCLHSSLVHLRFMSCPVLCSPLVLPTCPEFPTSVRLSSFVTCVPFFLLFPALLQQIFVFCCLCYDFFGFQLCQLCSPFSTCLPLCRKVLLIKFSWAPHTVTYSNKLATAKTVDETQIPRDTKCIVLLADKSC